MNNSTTVKGKYLSGGAFFIFYYIHKIKIKYFLLNGEVFPTIIIKSKKVWDILGCNSYARIDMIVSDIVPYMLEVNTILGVTK